jgi:hypothetical protein
MTEDELLDLLDIWRRALLMVVRWLERYIEKRRKK